MTGGQRDRHPSSPSDIEIEKAIMRDDTMTRERKNRKVCKECGKYLSNEETRFYTKEELKTGFKDWNTRILEIIGNGGQPKLSVHSAYMESDRVGQLHTEWDKCTVERLVDYLENWLERVKDLPDTESSETAKQLAKELGKIMNEIMNDPKVIQESIEFDRLLKNIPVNDLFIVYEDSNQKELEK